MLCEARGQEANLSGERGNPGKNSKKRLTLECDTLLAIQVKTNMGRKAFRITEHDHTKSKMIVTK